MSFVVHFTCPMTVVDLTGEMPDATVPTRLSLCIAFGIVTTVFMASSAKAQDAEPRSYSNTPVGLNFLIGGYLYSEGKIAFDPSSSVTDAQFHSHTGVLAVRAIPRCRR